MIVSGRDVLVQAPTGSGKTLAYLLPLAHALAAEDASGPCDATPHAPGLPSAIVFLPTRELAAQVFAHAEAHVSAAGFPCVLCVGGVPEAPQMAAIASGRGRVVVGTPGRVKEFFDRGAIRTDALIVQVLDEADRLLDGGFEQDVEAVMRPPGDGVAPCASPRRCLRDWRDSCSEDFRPITPRYPYTDAEVATSAAPWNTSR